MTKTATTVVLSNGTIIRTTTSVFRGHAPYHKPAVQCCAICGNPLDGPPVLWEGYDGYAHPRCAKKHHPKCTKRAGREGQD